MDPRTSVVIASVAAWQPDEERGFLSQKRMLRFLSDSPMPFSREADLSHVTGSAVVISSAGALLHKHKLAGEWFGPGGHVDGDEWPWDAATRETLEETGINAWFPGFNAGFGSAIDGNESGPILLGIDVHDTNNGHVHYDLTYLLVSRPDQPDPPEGESQEVAWFPLEEALNGNDHHHRLALKRALSLGVEIPR